MSEKGSGVRGGRCCGTSGTRGRGGGGGLDCGRIEAVVSVDDRGQLVLPKDVRERAGIGAGDKLAIVFHGGHGGRGGSGGHCCLTLIKAESLAAGVRTMLGPMMKDIFDQGDGK
jgi:AbrB family looped-hinge helix DNA binding protein